MSCGRVWVNWSVLGLLGSMIWTGTLLAADLSPQEAAGAAVLFLESDDAGKQREAEAVLTQYAGAIEEVIQILAAREPHNWTMTTPANSTSTPVHFAHPKLRERYAEDLLFYFVPDGYSPEKAYGLLIFMHGGGTTTRRESAGTYVRHCELWKRVREAGEDFIVVAPSAPWNPKTPRRWAVPEADAHISAVIRESGYRFHIDPERIVLSGFSMGAGGAWHLGQRMSDRFAACMIAANRYWCTRFEAYRGLPLFIIMGQYDGFVEQRLHVFGPGTALTDEERPPRGLDPTSPVVYAHLRLQELGIPHVFKWHQGGHSLVNEARPATRAFAEWMRTKRRNPFPRRVFAMNPTGAYRLAPEHAPTPHRFWVSLGKTDPKGVVQRTSLSMEIKGGKHWKPQKGESFADYRKRFHYKIFDRNVRGAWADVTNEGENRFLVKTKNVQTLSLWLHPEMVDFSRPVEVQANGKNLVFDKLRPNLFDAVRSYKRRRDWGLIYSCELVVTISGKTLETGTP